MSEFFKSKSKLAGVLGVFLLVITLVCGSVAFLSRDGVSLGALFSAEESGEEETPPEGEPEPELPTAVPLSHSTAQENIHYNTPGEMRGVFLVPGTDFITSSDTSKETLKAEIDTALQNAQELMLNTVIVDTLYEGRTIYQTTDAPEVSSGFDILEYIVSRSREENFYIYTIFDASLYTGSGSFNKLTDNLGEFAEKYEVDGILVDGYTTDEAEDISYGRYLETGGAIGYGNYLRQTPAVTVRTAAKAIQRRAPGTQVGLLAHSVWANADEVEGGSATKAAYTSLGDGNADTKAFVESGVVDFVAVKAFGSLTDAAEPFNEVVSWWADLSYESGVPLYVVHASDKVCTDAPGWQASDQLAAQVINASELSGFNGSIFNNLPRMLEDPGEATTLLLKVYREEVEPEHILTELEVTKPEQTTFTTFEPVVTFTGASDPNAPVTINGEEIKTDASGYFTASMELKAGSNEFVIEHKEKIVTYSITRQVQVLKDVSPTGNITTDGGMSVTITAIAYQDAQVSASVGGSTISMKVDDSADSEEERDSNYATFVGEYTVPAATASVQSMGAITVHASWQGQSESKQGASITVNKKAQMEDGVAVVVTADQARTYPANTLNNIPHKDYYPLPRGAMDYAVGDELVYKKDGKTYTYQVLASGLRVESSDIQAISNDYPSGNVISGMEVESKSGSTYVALKTAQKVSYTFKYAADGVRITFHNTTTVPGNLDLSNNPIFSSAKWNDKTLTLSFRQTNGFMGYKGYYDTDGNLVFRFNNPPSSISSARIVVDPGHGGSDPGALGFLADYPERVLNRAIAEKLAAELEGRGATVLLLNNASGISLESRVKQAEDFGADLFISVHNNTASSASAKGTEVYYHYDFSGTMAATTANKVSSQFNTTNRGGKQSYFIVTLSPQFQSVLVECGFMSNKDEYEKLIKNKYQTRIAEGIADSASAVIKAAYSGDGSGSGVQSVGSAPNSSGESGETDEPDTTATTSSGRIELNQIDYTLAVGKTYTLEAYDYDTGEELDPNWKSGNTAIASVSSSGKVTAKKEGTVRITASLGDESADCVITVVAEGADVAADDDTSGVALNRVSYAEFEDEAVTLGRNSTERLTVTSDKGTVKPTDFTWKSSDTSVATVDNQGRVTAKKAGEAEITATSGSTKLVCEVTVTTQKVAVKGISMTESTASVVRGETKQLKVTFNPTSASNKDLTWSSGNSKIATVDSQGRVTGKNQGSTTITAKSKDGSYKATCTVKVTKDAIEPEYIDMEDRLEMWVDEVYQLEAYVEPENATNTGITWSSSNSSVVSVDQYGNIEARKTGTATITATAKGDSSVKATCTVVVTK